jgi:hypothetical protein
MMKSASAIKVLTFLDDKGSIGGVMSKLRKILLVGAVSSALAAVSACSQQDSAQDQLVEDQTDKSVAADLVDGLDLADVTAAKAKCNCPPKTSEE